MIRREPIRHAIVMASELDNSGLVLSAQPGTPLNALITSMTNVRQGDIIQGNSDYAPNETFIRDASSSFGAAIKGGNAPHNDLIEQFKLTTAKHVRNHLNYVKNVAKPLCVDIINRFNKLVKDFDVDTDTGVKVNIYRLPEFSSDPSLRQEMLKFAKLDTNGPLPQINLPQMLSEKIIEHISTGTGIDDSIKQWLGSLGDEFIQTLWNAIFGSTVSTNTGFVQLTQNKNGADYAFAIFLLANSLIDNPPENTEMSLAEYNTKINTIRTRAAVRSTWLLDEYDGFVRSKLLIKNYNPKEITVIGEVYDDWLANGGNNNLLTASINNKKPCIYVVEFEQRMKELYASWEMNMMLKRAEIANRKQTIYSQLLIDAFDSEVAQDFAQIYPDCKETKNILQANEWMTYKTNLKKALLSTKPSDFDNMEKLIFELMSNCVFYHSDCVYLILSGIEEAMKNNQKLTVEEAALISTIHYVTDYVFDQITIRKMISRNA